MGSQLSSRTRSHHQDKLPPSRLHEPPPRRQRPSTFLLRSPNLHNSTYVGYFGYLFGIRHPVVHHFGVGHQHSSPSRAPSANSGTCPYRLDRASLFISLTADVSLATTQRAKQDSSVHSQSASPFLETFEAVIVAISRNF